MSNLDDLAVVVELACLTNDRSKGEQAAMKRVAKKLDREWNKETVTNKRRLLPGWVMSNRLGLVESTWEVWEDEPEESNQLTIGEPGFFSKSPVNVEVGEVL